MTNIEKIKDILETNRVVESGKQFTVAYEGAKQEYISSCVTAIVLKHFDIKAAEREIISALSLQLPSGKIPKNTNSNFMEPPLLGYSVFDVFSKSKSESFLENIFPRLDKYYKWLAAERDIQNKHILSTIHPMESWKEFTEDVDSEIKDSYQRCGSDRKFIEREFYDIKSVIFNCVYLTGLDSMQKICKILGKESLYYKKEHEYVTESMKRYLYNKTKNMFLSSKNVTNHIFLPMFSGILTKSQAISISQKYLLNEEEFWTTYPIPGIPFSSKRFDSSSSGASSMLMNWFVFKGLLNYNLIEAVEDLYDKNLSLFNKGFWEKYDSMTGKGIGIENHINTTLFLDMKYLL